jgi:hypothetical protein
MAKKIPDMMLPPPTVETPSPPLPPSDEGSSEVDDIARRAFGSGEHLDGAFAAATGAPDPAAEIEPMPVIMPREEWCKLWLSAHGMAGEVINVRALAGVPTRNGALDAAGAIYDTAKDTPSFHWLLDPRGEWMKRVIVVGMFYVPLAREVGAEMAARRRRKPAPRPPAAAAPSPHEPAQDGVAVEAVDE